MLQNYSHMLSHITSMFIIMQVVKQQGSDNTEGQDDYGMDDYDDIFNSPSVEDTSLLPIWIVDRFSWLFAEILTTSNFSRFSFSDVSAEN